ncbi:MAG: hypothetical protein NC924_02795 [Candidatus Omnitrophica bacterium]|nr:hypothetical protein [Candidatus Omnitrophota bacterium]
MCGLNRIRRLFYTVWFSCRIRLFHFFDFFRRTLPISRNRKIVAAVLSIALFLTTSAGAACPRANTTTLSAPLSIKELSAPFAAGYTKPAIQILTDERGSSTSISMTELSIVFLILAPLILYSYFTFGTRPGKHHQPAAGKNATITITDASPTPETIYTNQATRSSLAVQSYHSDQKSKNWHDFFNPDACIYSFSTDLPAEKFQQEIHNALREKSPPQNQEKADELIKQVNYLFFLSKDDSGKIKEIYYGLNEIPQYRQWSFLIEHNEHAEAMKRFVSYCRSNNLVALRRAVKKNTAQISVLLKNLHTIDKNQFNSTIENLSDPTLQKAIELVILDDESIKKKLATEHDLLAELLRAKYSRIIWRHFDSNEHLTALTAAFEPAAGSHQALRPADLFTPLLEKYLDPIFDNDFEPLEKNIVQVLESLHTYANPKNRQNIEKLLTHHETEVVSQINELTQLNDSTELNSYIDQLSNIGSLSERVAHLEKLGILLWELNQIQKMTTELNLPLSSSTIEKPLEILATVIENNMIPLFREINDAMDTDQNLAEEKNNLRNFLISAAATKIYPTAVSRHLIKEGLLTQEEIERWAQKIQHPDSNFTEDECSVAAISLPNKKDDQSTRQRLQLEPSRIFSQSI